MELAGEWAALLNFVAVEEIFLAKKSLSSMPDQPTQATERLKVQLAKVVDRQILNRAVAVSISQLLQMAPNLVPFVQA
jgi:hypothetical protein